MCPPSHFFLILLTLLLTTSASSLDRLIFVGCSQLHYSPGTPYDSTVDSILASLVNSASISNFNTFKISVPASDAVYGLYQCRGDLASPDCHGCIATAVNRLGTYCVGTSGAALQLEGCFVKYDNTSFVGTPDDAVVSSKCGPGGSGSDLLTRRDAVLAYLAGGGQYFRVGGSGEIQGLAQCVQDLSLDECRECLSGAIQRLKSECGSSAWGDVFLGKCYARYSEWGGYSSSSDGAKLQHLAIWAVRAFTLFTVLVL